MAVVAGGDPQHRNFHARKEITFLVHFDRAAAFMSTAAALFVFFATSTARTGALLFFPPLNYVALSFAQELRSRFKIVSDFAVLR